MQKPNHSSFFQYNITQIPGEYLIYPAQPAHPPGESLPWVPPDTLIYNSDDLFPGEFIRIIDNGIFDGARIVTIEVRPLQYRPKSKRMFIVNNINLEFSFSPDNPPELRPLIRGIYEQATYDAALRDVVVNDYEIPAYYQRPTIVEENQLGNIGRLPVVAAPGVIITPTEFSSSFQPYADWMTDQGIPTVLISPQTIYANFPGIDNAERVRNYIKYCWENEGSTYFILGGDDYFMPIRYGSPVGPHGGPNDSIPCDMYFSDLTGNWDVNTNQIWGEIWEEEDGDSADRFPEVFVGRITAYNTTEVQNWVTKALHYEKTPGVIFDTVLWVRSSNIGGYNYIPPVFPRHIGHIIADDYYADDALDLIDWGYGYLNIVCHGSIKSFWVRPSGSYIYNWTSVKNDNLAGLNWLTNLNKYFVGYTISCHVGAFDSLAYCPGQSASDTCVADAFVDAYLYNYQSQLGPFGACAFLANTRTGSLPTSLDLRDAFWDKVFFIGEADPYSARIGVVEAMSKCAQAINWDVREGRHVCYAHNLFGSPCFETWTKTPGKILVTHPTCIPAGTQTQFTVTVKDTAPPNSPLQYAKVCLNKPGDVYRVGSTDANGQVTFVITPRTTGEMQVTVTRLHNLDNYSQYRPSQTTCQVLYYPGGQQSSGSGEMLPDALCITGMPTILKNNAVVKFGVPKQGDIAISVYDVIGSRMTFIKREDVLPGYYQKKIDTERLANGVYFVVLKQGDEKVSRKFLLVK